MSSSSNASYVSSSDSEVEYDLEVEGSSNLSEHKTSDEPGDAFAKQEQDGRQGMAASI